MIIRAYLPLLVAITISGSIRHAVAEPPDIVRLKLLCKQIVKVDRIVYLDCWVVFYGKSSSLVRERESYAVEWARARRWP